MVPHTRRGRIRYVRSHTRILLALSAAPLARSDEPPERPPGKDLRDLVLMEFPPDTSSAVIADAIRGKVRDASSDEGALMLLFGDLVEQCTDPAGETCDFKPAPTEQWSDLASQMQERSARGELGGDVHLLIECGLGRVEGGPRHQPHPQGKPG